MSLARNALKLLLIVVAINAQSHNNNLEVQNVTGSVYKVLQFLDAYYYQINLDGLLGITLAQVQVKDCDDYASPLLNQMQKISSKIKHSLSLESYKNFLFESVLTNAEFWVDSLEGFKSKQLIDLGVYKNWTRNSILSDRKAVYKSVPTDVCFFELLQSLGAKQRCLTSPFCYEMMLDNRVDKGYLLTHRLMYVLMMKTWRCHQNLVDTKSYVTAFCSLMLKEARTNERLQFPQRDIFLEQVVLCGMQGFEEFLIHKWRRKIVEWLKSEGCYESDAEDLEENYKKRSANILKFGCTDHTTGLGLAALALNLRYLLA